MTKKAHSTERFVFIDRSKNCKYFVGFEKMIDTLKDYVSPKRFSILAYICVILHLICGVILTVITTALRLGVTEKFSCAFDTTYAQDIRGKNVFFNLQRRLQLSRNTLWFRPVEFWFCSCVIYSLAVGNRIDETEDTQVEVMDLFHRIGNK